MKYSEEFVINQIDYTNKFIIPPLLDEKYGYLLANGFYNYQEYINHLASKAQDGDSEALETCLYYFGWRADGLPDEILGRYYDMLTSGGVDIYRTDTLAFLRLFSKEKKREILRGKRPSTYKAVVATKKMQSISNRLLQRRNRSEILEDLIDILINRILNYKQGERTLRKYMEDMFYLYVGDYVQGVFRSRDFMQIEYAREYIDLDNYLDYYVSIEVQDESKDLMYEWEKSKDTLGIFWVMGHTHPIFKELSNIERLVLKENFFLGTSQMELAEKFGIGRTVVRGHITRAINKVEEAIENLDIIQMELDGYNKLM